MQRISHLWRLRPLPADRHQNIVGSGSRGGRGGAAGHCCGPAPHILACRAVQVIITPTNHRCLTVWTKRNRQKTFLKESLKGRLHSSSWVFWTVPGWSYSDQCFNIRWQCYLYCFNFFFFYSTWHSNWMKNWEQITLLFLCFILLPKNIWVF